MSLMGEMRVMIMGTRLKKVLKRAFDFLYIPACVYMFITFLLRWCSWEKFKAFVHEYPIRSRILRSKEVASKMYGGKYNGKRIFETDEANDLIGNAIEAGKPFMASRYGDIELRAIWIVRDDGKGFLMPSGYALDALQTNSGFFPKDKKLMIRFAELMKESTYQIDLLAVWYNRMEQWMARTYGNNPQYCRLHALQPFISHNPWSAKLEGKRVLVIHPFADTIRSQYAKREQLFPGKNILPEFQLRTVKAVQTIAGTKDERFSDWFEALDYMYNEAVKEDFDVAIIGCGAYGLPLAARIKQAGKIAIHLAGALQLMFGIMGRRWENDKIVKSLRNSAWIRPSESERPKRFDLVERGSYW